MLVGQSAVISQLRVRIDRVAKTNFTVLVEGESGAGKELVAREIHARSPRRRGPFVAVNCAALVETLVEAELFGIEERTATGVKGRRGKFELADHGTLFLDEVGDLSPTAQAKLLRVVQDLTIERVGAQSTRAVDTRIIAATNRSLHEMVAAAQFRADLYYRLSGVEVLVPPLRARREDVPLLIEYFLGIYGTGTAVPMSTSTPAQEALSAYDWPGNVRQLARVIERAIALATSAEITLADLPDDVRRAYGDMAHDDGGKDDSLRAWSSRYVRLVLNRCRGNKSRACNVLDISYHTLQSHLDYARETEEPAPEITSSAPVDAAPALRDAAG